MRLAAIQKALEILGFGPCYHMRVAMNEYPRDCAMWMRAFRAKYDHDGQFGRKEWDQLLARYSVGSVSTSISFQHFQFCKHVCAKKGAEICELQVCLRLASHGLRCGTHECISRCQSDPYKSRP